MKKIFTLILLISTSYLFAQGEAANWFFGNGAGLRFDIATGEVTPTDDALGTINTNEGCSSISDVNGNLLFYTDGRNVWDSNFQVMPNANYNNNTGLLGDPSSTSSALIVPKPGNLSQYYIFTVDEPHHDNAAVYPDQFTDFYSDGSGSIPDADDGFNNGLNYSLIDLTLNGGTGDVVDSEKNVPLITYDPTDLAQASYKCAEKITAVEHADGNSYWVITQFIDTYYAFRVTSEGVVTEPVTTTIGPSISLNGYRRNAIGYMKSSPDGSKLSICHLQNGTTTGGSTSNTSGLYLYDFNIETGVVSNETLLSTNNFPYGVEFSADSKKVYASFGNGSNNSVSQFDLDNDFQETVLTSSSGFIGSLQLAPNGKIYLANLASNLALDVIENPEQAGLESNYVPGGQPLSPGTNSQFGLPPFIQSFLLANIRFENTCFGDNTMFTIESSETIIDILWDFGDGNTSTDIQPTHMYLNTGDYTVTVTITTETETKVFSRDVEIYELPFANAAQDISVCDMDNDALFTFEFSDITSQVLATQNAEVFSVHYFTSQEDADNFENEIGNSFQNESNPQLIFARIHNIQNTSCYDITSFNIEVFNTPIANPISPIITCDDMSDGDETNGQTTINLQPFIADILGTQNPDNHTISFHPTQDDANNNTSPLSLNYYTINPLNDLIFARIENNLNTNCFSTTPINITVNPIPEVFNATLIQCDEDGIPEGFTTFDLTQATEDIVGNQSNISLKYYTSLEDLNADEDAIDPEAFSNWFNPQIIYVLASDDTSNCTNIAELTLEVSTTSIPDFTPTPLCDELNSEDGINTFTLTDIESELQALNAITFPVTFYETYLDALLEENALGVSYTNTSPYFQTIFARVENDNACYGIAEIDLVIYPLPELEDDETVFYCLNEYPNAFITLSGAVINDISNDYYYEWFFNGTDLNINEAEISVNDVGTYKVNVTSTEGCSKERTIIVEASNIATFETIEVTDGSQNNTITVLVSGEGTYQYALDDANGIYQDSNVFENVLPGFHTVFVRDIKNNCGTVDALVSVIGFPKFFTPNGDNYNERWHVKGVSDQFQPNSKILIFNRLGKLVSELSPSGPGWDGTYNGQNMPADDYWFFVTLQDGRVFKNHFSLKR